MNTPIQSAREALVTLKLQSKDGENRRQELFSDFLRKSNEADVPTIKVFVPLDTPGWFDVHLAYLFTVREDIRQFCWIISHSIGDMCVLDINNTNREEYVLFSDWDPDGDLYVHSYYGATTMLPWEHVKSDG